MNGQVSPTQMRVQDLTPSGNTVTLSRKSVYAHYIVFMHV